ncbi:DUF6746 family protein [Pseudidiomarina taiwanensis]|uniref:Uncharacterized protein n=1 Tax=Pseudidiomarina taiwanensis TaxID=337250 RepID=A0A432ZMW8_9GAMM|nr:DUF6746 family protein [Pseudidiomarina taiwanensis]RUO79235.1 hypothetical protein CWI83_01605 [Pseudidiomarina taiwanensis]
MKASFISAVALALALASATSIASDKEYRHFKGEPAKNLSQAVHNLTEYNAKLQQLLAKDELSASDMADIHELTYTLENALQRLDDEIDMIEEQLEAVHLGSEAMDRERVKLLGQSYLDKMGTLLAPAHKHKD